uniref:Uncharacterized protein n=1 Tax=Anguilla anguilla TaxID=7936 RepID=A0A0E9XU31_ANGAN
MGPCWSLKSCFCLGFLFVSFSKYPLSNYFFKNRLHLRIYRKFAKREII